MHIYRAPRTTNMASFYYKRSTSSDKLRDMAHQHSHGSGSGSQGYMGFQGW